MVTSPVLHDMALNTPAAGVYTFIPVVRIWGLPVGFDVVSQQTKPGHTAVQNGRARNFHVTHAIHVANSREIADCEGVWA